MASSLQTQSQLVKSSADFFGSLANVHVWFGLGLRDVKSRYRRSVIGPFWITISMGAMILATGILFSQLFNTELTEFLPFIAIGFILWTYLNSALFDCSTSFIDAGAMIHQTNMALSIHLLRVISRNFIIFAHNLLIFFLVCIYFQIPPSMDWLLSILGLALVTLNLVSFGLLLATLSARFRDIPQIVSSIMQMVFFVTPVIWQPSLIPNRNFVLVYNPFYHFYEVVRSPLLNQPVDPLSWIVVCGLGLLTTMLSFAVFTAARRKIAYWV